MSDHRPFESFVDSTENGWRIEWDRDEEPQSRETSLPAIAWYAYNYDPEAEVHEL